jgi:hypothetical protein
MPALSRDGQTLRYVVIFWEYKGRLFGVELSFVQGDPNGSQYERVLIEVMRSFRPL